jgi:hypothetical protein
MIEDDGLQRLPVCRLVIERDGAMGHIAFNGVLALLGDSRNGARI